MSLSEVPHMTAFCLPQGQYTSLHLDTKQAFHPSQDKHKNNHKKKKFYKFHNNREFNSNENGPKGRKSVKKENKQ